MLKPGDQHLTDEEVEQLSRIRRTTASAQEHNSGDSIARHLSECSDCQRRLEQAIVINDKLASLRAAVPPSRGNLCPSENEWLNLAAGLKKESDSQRMIEHATTCDYCSPLLNDALTLLSQESSAEEKQLLSALESEKDGWRAVMAERIAASSQQLPAHIGTPRRKSTLWKSNVSIFRLSWATGIAAVLALVAWTTVKYLVTPDVNSLLATAYSEQRTIELRIAGAKYSPLRVPRGTGASRLDRPQALLSAEDLIARKLVETPGASGWLHAKARADVLEGNYEAALNTLSALPESPEVLIDLATAYYEKGEATGDPVNFGDAVDALGKALSTAPNDSIALYNRALVCERVSLYSQAIQDWENYLAKDPSSEWAKEAREHLRRLKEEEQRKEKSGIGWLYSLPGVDQPDSRDSSTDPEDRFEDYLALLSDVSLPLEPDDQPQRRLDQRQIRTLVEGLAKNAKREHADAWLEDLLTSDSPALHSGVADLAKAVIANAKADSASAQRYATEAVHLFNVGPKRNAAGEIRAKFEAMFAAKVDQDGTRCLNNAARAEAEAMNRSYVWLQIQFLLEEGSCQWLVGNLGDARDKYLAAAKIAKTRGYQSLYLRSQDHLSGIEIETGNYETAWRITFAALNQFWSGQYADVRGYNLYYNLYELSRLRHQPYLQLAAWRDGVKLSATSQDVAQKAMAHALLGNSAWEIRDQHTSIEELETAASLFAVSPETRSTRLAQLETESRRATIETALGDAERAAKRLRPLENAVQAVHDPYLSILFYTSLGDAELEGGNVSGAESALRSAVEFAELQLVSLKDEESRVEWNAKSGSAYRNLVEVHFEKGDANGALNLWESYRGAPLRGRLRPASSQLTPPAGVEGGQSVIYALLPRSLAIWVSSGRGVRAFWARRKPGKIELETEQFKRLCAHPQSDRAALIRQGKELYLDLVAPIESLLSWTGDLNIEPDDAMTGLAFEALSDQEGHYLGEKIPLTVSLGPYYEQKTRKPLPITPNLPALIVAIRSSSALPELSLPPIPDAQTEGEGVAFRFRNADLLTGSDANEKAVLTALADSSVFHFSGHALSSPKRSGLLLSNALLRASALDASHVSHLQLAVLSACASEGGSNGNLTDSDSLVRTLLSRGVPHVVASRWEVDSQTTSRFMALFYEKVLSGDSVPTAIHKAQASLRANPETIHPFYWSAFVAFGRD